jgi:hypothetical protein
MAIDDISSDLERHVERGRNLLVQLDGIFAQVSSNMKGNLDSVGHTAKRNEKNLTDFLGAMSSFRESMQNNLSNSFKDAIRNGSNFADVFTKIRLSLEDLVLQLGVVNPALNVLFGGSKATLAGIGSVSGGSFKDGGLFGSLLGGVFDLFEGRASGGPVKGGVPYIVGERGPELFVPPTAGRIAPNVGSNPISITMNISTNNAESFRASQAQVAAAVLDSVRRAQRIR